MCTLSEADIHGDISGISSLIRLDLNGKNFITIPLALTQLSRLKLLKLSDCKMLKSLPELPTIVASPSKVCNLVGCDEISAINCFKLAEKINALTQSWEFRYNCKNKSGGKRENTTIRGVLELDWILVEDVTFCMGCKISLKNPLESTEDASNL
ncbi:hypothetical protein GOBAR_AA27527 [Gossypium barbadense]|uniref:NB-ARC domain-containing protein n=1 Tax=Gossypium barbadense TaxID=3634 RepID=A0A2P5WPY7_GOSBA|nr:hypothetical protein GOBAR_AA27527 [Gossypium barbadense]